MAQDGRPRAFPSSFSGAMRILSKLRCQELFVLSPLSFALTLIHSVVCVEHQGGEKGRKRTQEERQEKVEQRIPLSIFSTV